MLPEIEKRPIAGDDVDRASLESRGDVLVVVRVLADAGELLCASNQVRQHDEVLEPQLRVSATEQLAQFGISHGAQHLVHDCGREHHLETRVAQKPFDEPARCARGLDDGADVDVRVEDSAEQGLPGFAARLAEPLPRRALRLEGDRERSFLAHRALLLLLEEKKRMPPRKTPHLLQPLDWHQRGEWLALPLDDKLVATKGYPVEQVTDSLANVDGEIGK